MGYRTRVRSHIRRSKKGKMHQVSTHTRRVKGRRPLPTRIYRPVVKRDNTDRLLNSAFTGLSIIYPQYKLVIGTCQHVYNNREFYGGIYSEVISDKSNEEKLENLSHLLYDKVKNKTISTVSDGASAMMANIIDEKVGFGRIESSIMKSKSSEGKILLNFFTSSMSDLLISMGRVE